MFITLPKVFASMGLGTPAGILFFLLVLFAALTSSISLLETSVSTFEDQFHWSRKKAVLVVTIFMLLVGSASALGFGVWSHITPLGMGILDFFDFLTNSLMMPIAALAIIFLVVRVMGVDAIADEVESSSKFKRKGMYKFFIKYFAPVCIAIILISSILNVFGIISM